MIGLKILLVLRLFKLKWEIWKHDSHDCWHRCIINIISLFNIHPHKTYIICSAITVSVSSHVCLFLCVCVCERKLETERSRQTDECVSSRAYCMRQSSEKKMAGIIKDYHSFILSLPITVVRGLRDEDNRPCSPHVDMPDQLSPPTVVACKTSLTHSWEP